MTPLETSTYQTKYLNFIQIDNLDGRKTKLWKVCNLRSGDQLGSIKWYRYWRQYCFFPYSDSLFNANCLEEIQEFIRQEMRAWRANKK